ncbi:MAG: rhodanese-like domain-containing protein [Ignavibacteria bacterium]
MKINKTFREILIIVVVATLVGLLWNWINPKGLPLINTTERYSKKDTVESQYQLLIGKEYYDPNYELMNNVEPLDNPRYNKKGKFVEPQKINLSTAKKLFDIGALFIDARLQEEYNNEHIQNAINLPYAEFHKKSKEEQLQLMQKYTRNRYLIIVVYCSGGECEVSIDLAYDIARLGYHTTNIYTGGFEEWKKAGYPTSK